MLKILSGEDFAPWLVRTARSIVEAVAFLVLLMVVDSATELDFGAYTPHLIAGIKLGAGQLEGIFDQIDPGKVRANDNAARLREGLSVPPETWPSP